MIGTTGFGPASVTRAGRDGTSADAQFDRRQGNSVQYWTPDVKGFAGRIAYSANEDKSADNAVPEINPHIWSVSAVYLNGPIYVAYAYERHTDYFGLFGMQPAVGIGIDPTATGGSSSKDDGHKLIASYTFANTMIAGTYERLDYRTSAAGEPPVSPTTIRGISS